MKLSMPLTKFGSRQTQLRRRREPYDEGELVLHQQRERFKADAPSVQTAKDRLVGVSGIPETS